MTYSIVAWDPDVPQWGVAVQSKFLAVGSVVSAAAAGVGAVATQAWANPQYGPDGLALLREGLSAAEVVERLIAADPGRDERQLGIVDRNGASAAHTGPNCHDWAGHRTGDGYTAQGNILVSRATVDALAETFEAGPGQSLARRLIDCLAGAQVAGGDKRGQQSAALLVVQEGAGYAGLTDVIVDLRVDDHERPIEELRRLYGLHDRLFGVTPDEDWLPLDGALADEVTALLNRTGYMSLREWAGAANLEERMRDEPRIDPVVLEALREDASA
ncbi:MAG TPA: DUF1028 domain-containing protein [Gaiellaceae bacterium]|jgi:uncharacterized Ntn-hydrolase superfamily protein